MNGHHMGLSLPPKTSIGLLIQFQRPGQPEPDQDVSALLDVQAMSGRCRVDQCNRDVPGVPILDVSAALDVPDFDFQLRQMADDTLPVMLKPVSYQHRLSIGRLDQVFEGFQLVVVNDSRFAILVIDRAIAHLQQLPCQGCSIGSVYVTVFQRDQKILPEHIVEFPFLRIHLDFAPCRYTIRHIEIIQSLHGNRDVRDPLVDHLLCSLSGYILEHDACCRVHRPSLKVGFPVAADKLSKALPAIQNPNLCPQIHKAVGRRCAGQTDPPLHKRTDFSQELKTLGLIVLER